MFKNLNLECAFGLKLPLQERVKLARMGHYHGIDLDVVETDRKMEATPCYAIRQLMQQNKLKFGGWHLPIKFLESEPRYLKGLQKLREYAKIASELECNVAYTWFLPYSNELNYEENFDLHVKRLKPIARILSEHGCSLALEFVGTKKTRDRGKHEFIYNIDGTLRLCREIGEENVGLLLDSWHWYASRGTLDELRALKKNQVLYVHVNDAPPGVPVEQHIDPYRCLPGETGIIDLVGFLKSLKQIGYDGPVTPEPFPYDPLMALIFSLHIPFNEFSSINYEIERALLANFWKVILKLKAIPPQHLYHAVTLLRKFRQVPTIEAVALSSMFLDKTLADAGVDNTA